MRPARKSQRWHTIYLTMIGEFTPDQERVVDVTAAYLACFFDAPVRRRQRVPLVAIPAEAQREHPLRAHRQLLATYIIHHLLLPDRPEDALANLAITASDLWSEGGWTFVFGEASYGAAVWSISRFGDPSQGRDAYLLCLQRSLGTATHETGHVLGMDHCIEYECSMNGCNSLDESDRKPLHLCPPCLRKLCWNLQVTPQGYLRRLQEFMQTHGFQEEADWYHEAILGLGGCEPMP
jgi:archaemetzincin